MTNVIAPTGWFYKTLMLLQEATVPILTSWFKIAFLVVSGASVFFLNSPIFLKRFQIFNVFSRKHHDVWKVLTNANQSEVAIKQNFSVIQILKKIREKNWKKMNKIKLLFAAKSSVLESPFSEKFSHNFNFWEFNKNFAFSFNRQCRTRPFTTLTGNEFLFFCLIYQFLPKNLTFRTPKYEHNLHITLENAKILVLATDNTEPLLTDKVETVFQWKLDWWLSFLIMLSKFTEGSHSVIFKKTAHMTTFAYCHSSGINICIAQPSQNLLPRTFPPLTLSKKVTFSAENFFWS